MDVLPEATIKQTALAAYFDEVHFDGNKVFLKMPASGTRYLISGRVTDYGEVLTILPATSVELVEKHGGIKITSRKEMTDQVVEIDAYSDGGDFGQGKSTQKFILTHFVFPTGQQREMTVLEEPSKSVSLK